MTKLCKIFSIISLLIFFAKPSIAEPRHGLSIFGNLKYPSNFTHFDYVKPDSPKRGEFSTNGGADYNSFNVYISNGTPAFEISYLFDSLMVKSADEPDSYYGLIAKSAEIAADKMSVTFYLRPEAKFSDGTFVTAEDVANSLELLKTKGSPNYRILLQDVVEADVINEYTITYKFKGKSIRDLPTLIAGLPVFSKRYYEKHDFTKTTLKPPLGSGPYKVKDFSPGKTVILERRRDYWAKDLPVNRGRYNFDILRFEYFKDRTAELEALKSGMFDFREEFTSKDWATAYNIQAIKKGLLIKEIIPDERIAGGQGFFFNLRKDKFKDVRVRKALSLVFNFEWTNSKLFYGLYKRTNSYFENSDLKANGLPSTGELEIIRSFGKDVPEDVLIKPAYIQQVIIGQGREIILEAIELLNSAGWKLRNGKLYNSKGDLFTIEFLTHSNSFDKVIGSYAKNLERIGIISNIRMVNINQYIHRLRHFKFDIITNRQIISLTPGLELQIYMSSKAADSNSSRNYSGIKNPVVDSLIEKITAASSREELSVITKILDRVLRAGHYWVPQWYKNQHHIVYWDKFSRPKVKPKYDRGVIDLWWYDNDKAAKLAKSLKD